MSRNGPGGQPAARAPLRRPAAEADEYAGWPPSQAPDPHQQGYAPQAPLGAQQHGQGYYFPQAVEGDRNHGYAAQPAGQPLPFDRLPPVAQPPGTQWDGQRDAGHYDLGSYLPTAGYGQPEPPPFAQSADGPFRHQYAPGREHGYGDADGDYEALTDEEGDEPRRGRRGLLIAGALIGAIGLGGAMAYTYKTFIATPTRAPVVKVTDSGPSKVKPSLTGGKEFANADKKLLNRLDEEAGQRSSGAAADDRANEDPNAPRRVRSIPISPAGQMAAAAGGGSAAVPGITLDNVGPPASGGVASSPPGRVQISARAAAASDAAARRIPGASGQGCDRATARCRRGGPATPAQGRDAGRRAGAGTGAKGRRGGGDRQHQRLCRGAIVAKIPHGCLESLCRPAAEVRRRAVEQDARRAGSQPRRQGYLVSGRGGTTGIARCGIGYMLPAQGGRLRRLLGDGLLAARKPARAARVPTRDA